MRQSPASTFEEKVMLNREHYWHRKGNWISEEFCKVSGCTNVVNEQRINSSPIGPSTPVQPCCLLLEIQTLGVSTSSSNLQAKGASHYHLFHRLLSPHINNYINMV